MYIQISTIIIPYSHFSLLALAVGSKEGSGIVFGDSSSLVSLNLEVIPKKELFLLPALSLLVDIEQLESMGGQIHTSQVVQDPWRALPRRDKHLEKGVLCPS